MTDLPQLCDLPYIDPEDFREFALILAGDDDFPATYADWDAQLQVTEEEVWSDGNIPVFTGVTPAGFREFVAESTASADVNSLMAYVALLASAPVSAEQDPTPEHLREEAVA